MSTDLTNVDVNNIADFFEEYGDAMRPTMIVGSLLLFNKYGEYTAGQERTPVPLGTQVIADMSQLRIGWIRWMDNKPTEQRMGLLIEGFRPPKRDELGDSDKEMWEAFDDGREKDPWQMTNQIVLGDPETETVYTFATQSKGGLSAIGELCKIWATAVKKNPGNVQMPIIELQFREYKHPNKQYGNIRTPKFNIVGWTASVPDWMHSAPESSAELPQEEGPSALPPPREAAPQRPAQPRAAAAAPKGKVSYKVPPKKGNGPAVRGRA